MYHALSVLNPKSESSERVQFMASLIVLDEATACAPASASINGRLRRGPFPRPIELDRGCSASRIISHKLDLRIFVKIGVGVELSRD